MDIVQALFVDLISRPPKSLDISYLYRAVNNRCLNLIRNQRNHCRLLADGDDALRGPERTPLGDTMLSMDLLVRLLSELDQKSAEIVIYHFIDDMNQTEVAEQMRLSRRAVVKRLAKIRLVARGMFRAASQGDADPFQGAQA